MIKTQIQLPEELYRKAKAVAKNKEMSFAEVVRRGVEYITTVYPENASTDQNWKPIVVDEAHFRDDIDFDTLDLKELIDDEIRL